MQSKSVCVCVPPCILSHGRVLVHALLTHFSEIIHTSQIDASHAHIDTDYKLKEDEREFLHSKKNHPHFRLTGCNKTEEEGRKQKVKWELSELGKITTRHWQAGLPWAEGMVARCPHTESAYLEHSTKVSWLVAAGKLVQSVFNRCRTGSQTV